MSSGYDREQAAAVTAVRAAARICQAVRREMVQPAALVKTDRSPVTIADYAAQAMVCAHLERAFPDDPVVGEESAAELRQPGQRATCQAVTAKVAAEWGAEATAERVLAWIDRGAQAIPAGVRRWWTIDPIDGTKGFLRGEQYAVALGLIEDGKVVVGALACPHLPVDDSGRRGVLLTAVRGRGTVRLPLEEGAGEAEAVQVGAEAEAARGVLAESWEAAHQDHRKSEVMRERLGMTQPALRMDSQAKYACVARGVAHVYVKMPMTGGRNENIWDHAAGMIVVEEAGGKVTDLDGKPLDFGRGKTLAGNRGVLATNGRLHEAWLQALREG